MQRSRTAPTRFAPLLPVVAGLLAAGVVLAPAPAEGQAGSARWTVVPVVGLSFHGDYYDDRVITTFADDDIELDRLKIDPGTSVRLGARVEYRLARALRLHGELAASWPDAEVEVNGQGQPDVEMSLVELVGGAHLMLQELAPRLPLPLYVAGEVGLFRHSLDDFLWEDRFADVTDTSLGLAARAGLEKALAPGIAFRAELRASAVDAAYGDLEGVIARAEELDEGQGAETDFQGNTISLFSLHAGVAFSF